MLEKIKIENILFLDIETVPLTEHYNELSAEQQELWDEKAKYFLKNEQLPEDIYQRAGIYAEFGKIVCISVGNIRKGNCLRIKSFYNHDEKIILNEFCELLKSKFNTLEHFLCAHNGKEFDFPYIARRCLINQIHLPRLLNIAGKKPWEVKHFDTLELWKFGDYKHYTSLRLLTSVFNIPTPKDDIDGSQVANVYYKENNLYRIAKYCEKDVIATVQLFLKFNIQPVINQDDIVIINPKKEY